MKNQNQVTAEDIKIGFQFKQYSAICTVINIFEYKNEKYFIVEKSNKFGEYLVAYGCDEYGEIYYISNLK